MVYAGQYLGKGRGDSIKVLERQVTFVKLAVYELVVYDPPDQFFEVGRGRVLQGA
jgi:hypothetical protein